MNTGQVLDPAARARTANEALARACAEEGWRFVDATTTQLDPAMGLIRSELVQHGTGDHYLSETAYRRHVTAALPARPHP